jgi:glycosyltransferase involved in cell wall biosynthesis
MQLPPIETLDTTPAPAQPPASSSAPDRRLLVVTTIPLTFAAFLVPFAQHFRSRGWTVDLATGAGTFPPEAAEAVDRTIEIPWSRCVSDRRNVTQATRVFRRVVRDGHYDIVHVHTPVAASVARASLATLRRPHRPRVVYTAHGFYFGAGGPWHHELPFQIIERVLGRYTDRLIVINDTDRANAERRRIVRRDRIVQHAGIGVDFGWYDRTEALLARASHVRAELGVDAESPMFTIVAALQARKGQVLALQALARMRRADAHLVLAGSGDFQQQIQAEITRLGLADRVHLLGDVEDVRPLILASDATVLPSVREGLSRAVLESLLLGVPVVGSDIRGIAEAVRPDGGILVPPNDAARLAAALDTVADRPLFDDERRSGIRARLAEYSIDTLLAAHDRVYSDVLARAGV